MRKCSILQIKQNNQESKPGVEVKKPGVIPEVKAKQGVKPGVILGVLPCVLPGIKAKTQQQNVNDEQKFPVAIGMQKISEQHPSNEESGKTETLDLKQTIILTASTVQSTKQVVDRVQQLFKFMDEAKAALGLFIKQLQEQIVAQNLRLDKIVDVNIFTEIALQIVSDFAFSNKSANETRDEIRFLQDNFTTSTMKGDGRWGDPTKVFGVTGTNRAVQYQKRILYDDSIEEQVGAFGESGMEGFCTIYYIAPCSYFEDQWWECQIRANKFNGVGRNAKGKNLYEGEFKDNKKEKSFYEGEFKDDKKHGKGMLKVNDLIYEGDWECGYKTGRGKLIENGDTYEGDFNHGNYSGRGRLTNKNGDLYEGEFKDGEFQGKGKYQVAEFTYEGSFDHDKYNGKGRYQTAAGYVLDGDWVKNIFQGKGKYYIPMCGENKFVCDVNLQLNPQANKFEGKGIIRTKQGDIYEGQLQQEIYHGHRKLKSSQNEYEYERDLNDGGFKDNIANGRGKLTSKNGDVYEGEWKREEDEYVIYGVGIISYSNGDTYAGSWRAKNWAKIYDNNLYKRHGQGKLVRKNGEVQEGTWEDDQLKQ